MSLQAATLAGALPRRDVDAHLADALAADAPAALARARAYHTLDALRGIAALCVLLFHAAFFLRLATPAEGYLAVDLFFVMSGFIIAHRYDGDLAQGMRVRRFLRIRLVRLYPLFALGTLLGALPALAALAGGHADGLHEGLAASLPLALVMLPSRLAMPDLTVAYPLNYVSWSLALELIVNVAFAASFKVWTTRRLAWLVAASFVGVALAAWRFGSLNIGWDWGNAIGGVPRILFGFALGVLLQRRHATRPFVVRIPWWALVAAVPALLFLDPAALGLAAWHPVWGHRAGDARRAGDRRRRHRRRAAEGRAGRLRDGRRLLLRALLVARALRRPVPARRGAPAPRPADDLAAAGHRLRRAARRALPRRAHGV